MRSVFPSSILCFSLLALLSCKTTKRDAGLSSTPTTPNSAHAKPRLAMHDVSVLFPDFKMGGHEQPQGFIAPDSPGKGGVLLPKPLLPEEFKNTSLTVVAFRIDPCFPRVELLDSPHSNLCHRQIRLVWTHPNPAQISAVHAAYHLTEDELKSLIKDVAALGDHSEEGLAAPLGVHPLMAKEGIDGPTAKAMRTIIQKYAGEKNLEGLAFLHFPAPRAWAFSAIVLKDGRFVDQKIPTLGDATEQPLRDVPHGPMLGGPVPRRKFSFFSADEGNPHFETLRPILDTESKEKAMKEDIIKTLQHAALLDHPINTHFDTSDCSSCHISTIAIDFAAREEVVLPADDPALFRSTHNLSNPSARSIILEPRNFAHSGAISQRTINESAQVVDTIIKHGFYTAD